MSTHVQEYLIYGIRLDKATWKSFQKRVEEANLNWDDTNDTVYDSAFEELFTAKWGRYGSHRKELLMLDGEDYALIGRELAVSNDDDPLGQGDPILIPVPDPAEALRIAKQIRNVFGIQQPLGLHFVAHYH